MAIALILRVIAAVTLDSFVRKLGPNRLCLFDDTNYYWLLARTIREGALYQIVEWGTITHKALRTPGYPLFLAACHLLFGEWPLGVRLVQAVLGMLCVLLIFMLTLRFDPDSRGHAFKAAEPTAPLAAAILAAINPYYVAVSELLLSEALFIPLMLATLWGLAVLWRNPDEPDRRTKTHRALLAIGAGAASGAAILTRPSFAFFPPFALVCWLLTSALSRNRTALAIALRVTLFFALGLILIMSPWWIRNAQTFGRFVPTSVWFVRKPLRRIESESDRRQ